MAAIAGPGGPFVAAMVGPGPSWIAITGPPGPTVGGTSLRVTGLLRFIHLASTSLERLRSLVRRACKVGRGNLEGGAISIFSYAALTDIRGNVNRPCSYRNVSSHTQNKYLLQTTYLPTMIIHTYKNTYLSYWSKAATRIYLAVSKDLYNNLYVIIGG